MNISSVSDYENVNSQEGFSKSSIYRTINDLLSLNGDAQVKIFCPLCTNNFEYKFSLFEHLRTFHNSFLVQAGNRSLKFKECPFCNAKFYGEHLTVKHTLLHHAKVVRELFLNKNRSKCFFCGVKLNRTDCISVTKHIEELHYLEFEEEFMRIFSCESVMEMTISELINSSVEDSNLFSSSQKWEDVCMDVGTKPSEVKKQLSTSTIQDFTQASIINCYDFSELKEQLQNIKEPHSAKKSILKDVMNATPAPAIQKSARRVLRFDLPSLNKVEKENIILQQNIETLKKINIDEHNLFCNEKKEIEKILQNSESTENLCGEPQHSSTPNTRPEINYKKILVKDDNKNKIKPNFRCYLDKKNLPEFEFQCGRCRKLFKKNLDLVCHIKNNHKKFILNVLQPCYRCAICDAKFYKNYYLRKHHSLHQPY